MARAMSIERSSYGTSLPNGAQRVSWVDSLVDLEPIDALDSGVHSGATAAGRGAPCASNLRRERR
jgi:hypothetical protein